MDKIVGQEQNAFIKGRLISETILICHELMHSLKLRKRGHFAGMAVKLDINKAYECVEWQFLQHMMQTLGFHDKWINWVIQCATTVSYPLQINGHKLHFSF